MFVLSSGSTVRAFHRHFSIAMDLAFKRCSSATAAIDTPCLQQVDNTRL